MSMRSPGLGAPRLGVAGLPPNTKPHIIPESDLYYGQEHISKPAARFIENLFACPEYPQASDRPQANLKLPYFIAYALHRTKLPSAVTFSALALLQRLKARFPSSRGSSGHRLFLSAFMISSKVICDDTYSNKSWSIVAQGLFTLREINQMEREMCSYLEWQLTVDHGTLSNFERSLWYHFREHGGRQPQSLSPSHLSNSRSQTYPPRPLSPNVVRRRHPEDPEDQANGTLGVVSPDLQTDFRRRDEDVEAGKGYDTVPEGRKPRLATFASLASHLVSLCFTKDKDSPPIENDVRARTPDGSAISSTASGIFSQAQNTSISGGTFSVIHQTIESDPSLRKSVKHIVYLLSIQTAILF